MISFAEMIQEIILCRKYFNTENSDDFSPGFNDDIMEF